MNISERESFRQGLPGLQVEPVVRSRRRVMTIWFGLLVAVLFVAGSVWLAAQPRNGGGSFGPTGADPAYIVVNTPTLIGFTSQITDRQLKKRSVVLLRLEASGQPSEILGRLNDEGRRGDLKAGDGTYSFQTTLNEANVGKVGFRIAARFKPGTWREPEPDDDDWDRELTELAADRVTRRDRLSRLLRRLHRYTLSNVFYVTVDPFTLPPDPGEAGKLLALTLIRNPPDGSPRILAVTK